MPNYIKKVFLWFILNNLKYLQVAQFYTLTAQYQAIFQLNAVSTNNILELWTWSVMNEDCNERVCCEYGLLWTLSVLNVVSYERALKWTGLLWLWSVMNMDCQERALQWMCL